MHSSTLLVAFAACITLFTLTTPISATETPNSPETEKIETITVIAHRLAVPNSPVKVVLIDNNRLENSVWVGTDVLRQLPSLVISQSGALGSLTQIRGHGAEANHILVMLDGMPLNDPANGSEYNFASLSTTGLSAIHYLPSAASSTWGSDAIAGVLNLSSKPTRQRTQVEMTAGSFATLGVRGDVSRINEFGYFRVSADDFQTNGTNSSLTGDETEAFASTTTHLEAGLTGNNWSATVLYRRSDIEADIDPTPFPDFTPVDGPGQVDHQSILYDIKLRHMGFDNRLTTALRFGNLETENSATSGSASSGERQLIRLDNQWAFTDNHSLIVGFDFERQKFSQSGSASFFGDPNQKQSEDRDGIALGYTGSFGSMDLNLSVRRDNNEAFDNSNAYRVAGKYRLNDRVAFLATAATGSKNPSFIERFGFTPDTFIGNPNLKPETNQHYSAGLELNFDVFSFSASYFQDRLKDEINGFFFDLTAGGFTAVNQNGESDREGFDVGVNARLAGWLLDLRYANLKADENGGSAEIRRPESNLSFSAESSWWNDRVAFHLAANYVAEQDDFSFATFPATRVKLDNYLLMSSHISFKVTDKVQLKLQIDNLTDEEVSDVFGYRNPERRYLANVSLQL